MIPPGLRSKSSRFPRSFDGIPVTDGHRLASNAGELDALSSSGVGKSIFSVGITQVRLMESIGRKGIFLLEVPVSRDARY